MKHFYLMFCLLFSFLCFSAFGTETEPNNLPSQANTLALNSINSGSINPKGDNDWWKVTTTADGRLDITLRPSSIKYLSYYLYDNNTTTLLDSASANAKFIHIKDGLAPGTYYILIKARFSTDTLSYSIADTLRNATPANDAEPNNQFSQSQTLSINTTVSGHVGYYYNLKRDTSDWYKITTTADGKIQLKLNPVNGSTISIALIDNNGSKVLASNSSNKLISFTTDGLAAGTYYVKLNMSNSGQFTPYTLTDSVFYVSPGNDAEPNNHAAQALNLNLNSTRTGHVGYYYNNVRDTADWYKLTFGSHSKLKLMLTPANGQSLNVSLFADNGLSLINSTAGTTKFTQTTDGLKDGIYYVRINASTTNGFGAYTLMDSIFKNTIDTLILPLNEKEQDTIAPAGSVHWWSVITNADGRLDLTIKPMSGKYVVATIYDHSGGTQLGTAYGNNNFVISTDGLAAGTYYVKINMYYNTETSLYGIADTLRTIAQSNDKEPNNTAATASTLGVNQTTTGHVGYLYNNVRDTTDWYKITTNADGRLQLVVNPENGNYIFMTLYDKNGTIVLNTNHGNAPFSLITDGLAAGTYYVRLYMYYNSQFTPYVLTDSLFTPAQANDAEPNNNLATALTLGVNSSKVGHVGYYYNNQRDTTDWYKITTNADGRLQLVVNPVNGNYIFMTLYDKNGTIVLNTNHGNTPFSLITDGLAAGTYYVQLYMYYNSQFTTYVLSDSLFTPSQANDTEPNNNVSQAITLPVNHSTTGHVGYYYNNQRDSSDWYKITTTSDGMLKLILNPVNGNYTYINLYDGDGSTLLTNTYSNVPFSLYKDGLAAGTYYVQIFTYYNSQFTPYVFADSLITYKFGNDVEPNNHAAQANILPINGIVNGHVNFHNLHYNDNTDWYKFTLTSATNMQLKFKQGKELINNTVPYTWVYVYKDTASSSISQNYYNTDSTTINLNSLSAGTYYINVATYYSSDYETYTLSDKTGSTPFTEINSVPGRDVLPVENDVSIYPNPATTNLHIYMKSGIKSITMHEASGREVLRSNDIITSGKNDMNLDVSKLSPGIYLVRIQDKDGLIITRKIIVTR